MNVRFDLDNPIMRTILGIAEYFLDNRRNKIRSRAVVFPSSEPREIYAKKMKRSWGGELRWGFSFAALPFVCPRSTVTQKKDKRQLRQSGIKSKFSR